MGDQTQRFPEPSSPRPLTASTSYNSIFYLVWKAMIEGETLAACLKRLKTVDQTIFDRVFWVSAILNLATEL